MPEPATHGPSRRALLGGAAASAVLPLTGCAGEGARAAPAPVSTGIRVLAGAIASEQDLVALYEAVRTAHGSLARRIDPMLAHHREHLAVLRAHWVPGSGSAADDVAVPRARRRTAPDSESAALSALLDAEGKAARARAAEVARAAPGLAQLLASIGACESGHAAVLEEAR